MKGLPVTDVIPNGCKQCSRCKSIQECKCFSKDKNKLDGLRTMCKLCSKATKISKPGPGQKKCKRCGVCQDLDCFLPQFYYKDKLGCSCKMCTKEHNMRLKQRVDKKCSRCKRVKMVSEFHVNPTKIDGYATECAMCVVEKVTEYYATNKSANIARKCRARLRSALTSQNVPKTHSVVDLVGCTWYELKEHIQSQFQPGMSWSNIDLIHIDHRHPCAGFDLTDDAQLKQCFHWTNLQPLWATDNLKKGAMPHDKWLAESYPNSSQSASQQINQI